MSWKIIKIPDGKPENDFPRFRQKVRVFIPEQFNPKNKKGPH